MSPDGDPLDIILLCDNSLYPGCIVKCKIIGGINTTDEKGEDDKIIAVPIDKIDKYSVGINDISDINKVELDHVIYFLKHYKDNEHGKYINIGEIYNKETALKIIEKYTS